jgi:hypothetical protein
MPPTAMPVILPAGSKPNKRLGVAAREYEFQDIEGLIAVLLRLHNLRAKRHRAIDRLRMQTSFSTLASATAELVTSK